MRFLEGARQPGSNYAEYKIPSRAKENPKARVSKLIRGTGGAVAVVALLGIMGTDKASAASVAAEPSCYPPARTLPIRAEVMDAVIPEPTGIAKDETGFDIGQGKDKKTKAFPPYPLNPGSTHSNKKK